MVSSITATMPTGAQPADAAVKGTGSMGDSFQDTLQKTVQGQRNGPAEQEKTDAGKEPDAQGVRPEKDAGEPDEKTEKSNAGAEHTQIFVIPGQENLVLLLNQGLAAVSGQMDPATAEKTAVLEQQESMPTVSAAGLELQEAPAEQAAQNLAGMTDEKTLSPGKEIPVQTADGKTAGQQKAISQPQTVETAAAIKSTDTQKADQQNSQPAETKLPEQLQVRNVEQKEKNSQTGSTTFKKTEDKTQALQEEQPRPHLAAQTAQAQENPEAPQAGDRSQAENVFRPSQPETLPQELPAKLAESLSSGRRELTIQLEPESLGKMFIKASFEDGKAVVSITCTNAKTLELLSNHAKDMGAIMESHMGTPTNVVVEKSQPDYLAQQQNGRENQQSGEQKQQNEDSRKKQDGDGESFLQQLRLGLV